MRKMNKIEALIFDFDGLVLNTEGPVYESWQELYRSYDLELPFDKWVSTVGSTDAEFDPYVELDRLLENSVDWQVVGPRRLERELELIEELPLQPGVLQYLMDAKKLELKIGMASSSSCEWVQGHLTRLGIIDYFEVIRGKDDVRRTKPSPELYISVLDAFVLDGEQAIVLEDSLNGVLAAKEAGCFTLAVPNNITRYLEFDRADLVLNSLEDLSLKDLVEIAEQRTTQQVNG